MEILYEGTDITPYVMVRELTIQDTCGCRCDGAKIIFENAERWSKWAPKVNDEVRILQDGYDSGIMYLDSIRMVDDTMCLYLTSLSPLARLREWRSFVNKSIDEIFYVCAKGSGMESGLYGMEGTLAIPYIEQMNETAARFLSRLCWLEGAVFKCVSGKYAGIDLDFAQGRKAIQTITLDYSANGKALLREGTRYEALTVKGAMATAIAMDAGADGSVWKTKTAFSPPDVLTAGRWARGLLKHNNREAEALTVESEFNPGFSACARIDVTGGTDADGKWIIDTAQHDMVNRTSTATMYRVIDTVA